MNILVIRFSALGDLVTLEPIFRAIRYFYKDAKIDFVTSGLGKGLYEDSKYFDNFIVHKEYSSSIKQLRQKKYDIVFNLHCNSLSHILILFCSKIKVVNSAANFFQKIVGKKIPVLPIKQTLNNAGINIELLNEYFDKKESNIITLPSNTTKLIKTNKKIISISTGSSKPWRSKQWGLHKYTKIIERLTNENYQVVLIGTSLELEDSSVILNKFPNVISFVDKTNLTELKSILKQSELYIGNDSGPSHIAAAVGVNTITIFGPTDIKHCVKFAPYNAEHICIKPSEKIKCHPCYNGVCPTQLECMADINENEVYEAVNKLIMDDNE